MDLLYQVNLCKPIFPHEQWMDWALLATISLPHFLYAYIWFFPNSWRNFFGKEAVPAFSKVAWFGKVLQGEACLLWLWASRSQGLCFDASTIPLWLWLASILMFAFGQALNVGIYAAIGTDGVYYGFKLGKHVPWVKGFPFNVVPHPQYVGSTLTVWGVILLLLTQVPAYGTLYYSLLTVAGFWASMYALTGIIEAKF